MKNSTFAKLDRAKLDKLAALERELQVSLVAFESPGLAELSKEELESIRAAEKELGAVLVAYR